MVGYRAEVGKPIEKNPEPPLPLLPDDDESLPPPPPPEFGVASPPLA
jgi:hypothetical protein